VALKLDDKKTIVAEVADVAKAATSIVAAEYAGLSVAQLSELRKNARTSGVYMRVVRNTLARRAFKGTQFECMDNALVGPLLLAFSKEDPGAAARLMKDFAKKFEKLVVRALAIEGNLLPASDLNRLASLPTRDQAIAQLMSVMNAPITKFARTLAETYSQVVRATGAIRDKKQQSA
jgi:large subunit ribosomal protein L10